METRQLITFLAVIETGTFTRAAEKLGYAQSSITAQIQALEAELAAPLFDRLGKKLLLTEAGSQLFPYAQEMIALHNAGKQAILSGNQQVNSPIAIGAPESLAAFRLPAVIREFKTHYPELKIILKPGVCWEMLGSIRSGELDLAFVLQPNVTDEDMVSLPLVEERMALIAPPGHPLTALAQVLPESLKDEMILHTEQGCTYRDLFEHHLRRHGVYPSPEMEFWSIEAIKQCVTAGLGISLLPYVTVQKEIAESRLVHLAWDDQEERQQTQLVYHKKKWLSPQMKKLIAITERHAAQWRQEASEALA